MIPTSALSPLCALRAHPTRRRGRRGAPRPARAAQRGAYAVMTAISLVAVLGVAGLALDLGRLFVNKSELQSAADACALAAAAELSCPATAATCLLNAQAAGTFAARQNRSDFQRTTVTVAAADVMFSSTLTGAYAGAGAADPSSSYARCVARSAGLTPWVMGLLGLGDSTVTAQAVASNVPGRSICPNAPIGVCPKSGGGSYAVGDWVVANATANNNGATSLGNAKGSYGTAVKGTFRWVDYTPNAGGTNEVSDLLVGAGPVCGVSISTRINEEGTKQGTKDAYNTRFGVYGNGANAYTYLTAPPDRSGFSYPTTAGYSPRINVGTSAYADYRNHQTAGDSFQGTGARSTYAPQGTGNPNVQGNATSAAHHLAYGGNRRLITVPLIDSCTNVTHNVTASRFGCFLMLNPMANGNNGDTFLEYRGDAAAADSPCISAGAVGGPGTTAGSVAALVQ